MSSQSSESLPTPDILFSQLLDFAYENDPDFRSGKSLASESIWRQKFAPTYPPELYELNDTGGDEEEEEADEEEYDAKSISFEAIRSFQSKKQLPHRITIGFELMTQLWTLPPNLLPHLSEEIKEQYHATKPGDLHSLQSVEYVVRNDDGDIDITRNLGYILRDHVENVLYAACEIDESNPHEFIPLAHEQTTLRIPLVVAEEQHPDMVDQLLYDEQFSDLFDGVASMEFYETLVEGRDSEATLCILSLMKRLKTRESIPDILYTPPEKLKDI